MKRLALLAVTAFMAMVLSACGDNAEKRAEDNAATTVEQSQDQLNGAAKDADSKLQGSDSGVVIPPNNATEQQQPVDQTGQ